MEYILKSEMLKVIHENVCCVIVKHAFLYLLIFKRLSTRDVIM
jgi:hypothetical protein